MPGKRKNESMNKKWYAVYTKPRWEKKVAELLAKKKIENYCPLNRVRKQWADRKKMVVEPLFSCYVFVHASETELVPVRQTEGVISFVHWLGKPAVVRNEEIEVLKRFLRDYDDVKLEKMRVNINDRVRINSGPLMEMEGDVVEVKSRSIRMSLPSIGYAIIAEVKTSEVELISSPIPDKIINNRINTAL
jgi:transcription antitermination factor NusG